MMQNDPLPNADNQNLQSQQSDQLKWEDIDTVVGKHGPDSKEAAIALNRNGCMLQIALRYQEALDHYDRAILIAETHPPSGWRTEILAVTYANIGEIWCELGQGQNAVEPLQIAAQLIDDRLHPLVVAAIYGHQGWSCELMGDLPAAEALLLKALAIVQQHDTSPSQAEELATHLCRVLELQGDHATAAALRAKMAPKPS